MFCSNFFKSKGTQYHLGTVQGQSRLECCPQGDAVEEFTQIGRERLEKTFLVNIVGMISLAQKAVPHIKPGSAIINVRSTPIHLLPVLAQPLFRQSVRLCKAIE